MPRPVLGQVREGARGDPAQCRGSGCCRRFAPLDNMVASLIATHSCLIAHFACTSTLPCYRCWITPNRDHKIQDRKTLFRGWPLATHLCGSQEVAARLSRGRARKGANSIIFYDYLIYIINFIQPCKSYYYYYYHYYYYYYHSYYYHYFLNKPCAGDWVQRIAASRVRPFSRGRSAGAALTGSRPFPARLLPAP